MNAVIAELWTSRTPAPSPPVSWHFQFDVAAPAGDLWPFLVDTDRLNRAMGLPTIEYVERDGRMEGSSVLRGKPYRWVELPWAWVAGQWVSCLRVYESGLATHGTVAFEIEPRGPAACAVHIEIGFYPRGLLGRLVFPLIERRIRDRYARALGRLERELADRKPVEPLLARAARPLGAEEQRRLGAIRERLLAAEVRPEIADRVISHVERGDELELGRIRPRVLARRWSVDERELLVACLHATEAGLFSLEWSSICPHCRAVKHSARTLGDVPPRVTCATCDIEFPTDGPHAVEVGFQVHPSIRTVPKRSYCLAELSSKSHVRLQQTLAPGERRALETSLEPGRYRVRAAGVAGYRSLDIVDESAIGEVVLGEAGEEPVLAGPSPRIVLVNRGDAPRLFAVEDVQWADDALRPVDLFNLQEFRDLFSTQQLGADVQWEVGEQTIVFSDMVGSTRFYQRHGDAAAFAAVKKHFRAIYAVVKRHRGVVVKTIGDAAMAAFVDPVAALRAAEELASRFGEGGSEEGIRLRLSLNLGSAIAVNLDSGIDYFGKTVNLAAKLQACVAAGQIAFPVALGRDARVRAWLEERKPELEEIELSLPALGEPVAVYRWDTNGEAAPSSRTPASAGFY